MVSFVLGHNEYERLTELIHYQGRLFAIRSVRNPPHYSLVQLTKIEPVAETGMKEVMKWGLAASEFSSNFEGATISSDGKLYVCTDGPGFRKGSWRRPQPVSFRTLLACYGQVPDGIRLPSNDGKR